MSQHDRFRPDGSRPADPDTNGERKMIVGILVVLLVVMAETSLRQRVNTEDNGEYIRA